MYARRASLELQKATTFSPLLARQITHTLAILINLQKLTLPSFYILYCAYTYTRKVLKAVYVYTIRSLYVYIQETQREQVNARLGSELMSQGRTVDECAHGRPDINQARARAEQSCAPPYTQPGEQGDIAALIDD